MPADLLMIVPSRGRPQNVAALLDAWGETATGAADLLIAADDDDRTMAWPASKALHVLDRWRPELGVPRWEIGGRLRLGGTLNAIARKYRGSYRMLGFMGDDHRPRTVGWDRRMVEALDELGAGLVYGNDLIQGAALPTAVAMTSDIVRTLGYMVPPGLVHLYIDNAWAALGTALGALRYLPDVVIEHMHPIAGKAPEDALYREVNSSERYAADQLAYEDWVRNQMDADVAKLKAAIR